MILSGEMRGAITRLHPLQSIATLEGEKAITVCCLTETLTLSLSVLSLTHSLSLSLHNYTLMLVTFSPTDLHTTKR